MFKILSRSGGSPREPRAQIQLAGLLGPEACATPPASSLLARGPGTCQETAQDECYQRDTDVVDDVLKLVVVWAYVARPLELKCDCRAPVRD